MSSIVIKGNTSGQIELAAPDVAGSTTLTLPTGTGTVITDTAPKAGNVLQVVNATTNAIVTSTSSTWADTGLQATITPSSTSSKILVLIDCSGVGKDTNNTWAWLRVLTNGATNRNLTLFSAYTASTANITIGTVSGNFIDSPASTSAQTYKVQIASSNNVANVYMNSSNNDVSSITLMEIAG